MNHSMHDSNSLTVPDEGGKVKAGMSIKQLMEVVRLQAKDVEIGSKSVQEGSSAVPNNSHTDAKVTSTNSPVVCLQTKAPMQVAKRKTTEEDGKAVEQSKPEEEVRVPEAFRNCGCMKCNLPVFNVADRILSVPCSTHLCKYRIRTDCPTKESKLCHTCEILFPDDDDVNINVIAPAIKKTTVINLVPPVIQMTSEKFNEVIKTKKGLRREASMELAAQDLSTKKVDDVVDDAQNSRPLSQLSVSATETSRMIESNIDSRDSTTTAASPPSNTSEVNSDDDDEDISEQQIQAPLEGISTTVRPNTQKGKDAALSSYLDAGKQLEELKMDQCSFSFDSAGVSRSFEKYEFTSLSVRYAKANYFFYQEHDPIFPVPLIYSFWTCGAIMHKHRGKKNLLIANTMVVHPWFKPNSVALMAIVQTTCNVPWIGLYLCDVNAVLKANSPQGCGFYIVQSNTKIGKRFFKECRSDPYAKINVMAIREKFVYFLNNSRQLYNPMRNIKIDAVKTYFIEFTTEQIEKIRDEIPVGKPNENVFRGIFDESLHNMHATKEDVASKRYIIALPHQVGSQVTFAIHRVSEKDIQDSDGTVEHWPKKNNGEIITPKNFCTVAQFNKMLKRAQDLEAKLKSSELEKEKLAKDLRNSESEAKDLTDINTALEKENKKLEKELDKQQKKNNKVADAGLTKKAANALQKENSTLSDENNELKDELIEAREEIAKLVADKGLNKKNAEASSAAADKLAVAARKKLETEQAEVAQMQKQAKQELEVKLAKAEADLVKAESELKPLRNASETLESAKQLRVEAAMKIEHMSFAEFINGFLRGSFASEELYNCSHFLLAMCADKWKQEGITYDRVSNRFHYANREMQLPISRAESIGQPISSDIDTYQTAASPHIDSSQRSASPHLDVYRRSASPMIDPVQRSVSPHIDSYRRSASPMIDSTQRSASPHVESYRSSASPMMDSTQRSASPHVDSYRMPSSPMIDSAQRSLGSAFSTSSRSIVGDAFSLFGNESLHSAPPLPHGKSKKQKKKQNNGQNAQGYGNPMLQFQSIPPNWQVNANAYPQGQNGVYFHNQPNTNQSQGQNGAYFHNQPHTNQSQGQNGAYFPNQPNPNQAGPHPPIFHPNSYPFYNYGT